MTATRSGALPNRRDNLLAMLKVLISLPDERSPPAAAAGPGTTAVDVTRQSGWGLIFLPARQGARVADNLATQSLVPEKTGSTLFREVYNRLGGHCLGNGTLAIDQERILPARYAQQTWSVRQRTWLPVARSQPAFAVTSSMQGRSRSSATPAGIEARFSRSGHELLRSGIRLTRPGQELPGRRSNVPDLVMKIYNRGSAGSSPGRSSPGLKSQGSNLKFQSCDRVTSVPVRARRSPAWQANPPVSSRPDPT